jgi:hypothetical protein
MTVLSTDGRRVGARRNGFCHVSILDDRGSNQFTVDFARALRLADALESGERCQMPTNQGRVLQLAGIKLGDAHVREPAGQPQQPTGPWRLEEPERKALAAEIRAAVG